MAVAAVEQRCFRSEEESISLSPPYRAKSRGRRETSTTPELALAMALLSLLPPHPPPMETNIAAGIREKEEGAR